MKRFARVKLIHVVLCAGTLFGAGVMSAAPANARVDIGFDITVLPPMTQYYYYEPCADPRYRYYHPRFCRVDYPSSYVWSDPYYDYNYDRYDRWYRDDWYGW